MYLYKVHILVSTQTRFQPYICDYIFIFLVERPIKFLIFVVTKMQNKTELMDAEVRNGWVWGFSTQAETWNGRFAMIGFAFVLFIEVFSHRGLLHFLGILPLGATPLV